MNYVIKKAGISLLSGAMCTAGSWITKQLLDKTKEELTKPKEHKESNPT